MHFGCHDYICESFFLNLSLQIYLTGGLENVKLGMLIKNTILVTPDTTFIRRDQKQGRNRETCQAGRVEPDKLDIKRHLRFL